MLVDGFSTPSEGRLVQGPVVLTRILGWIGVVLILAGVVFGFRSVSAAGTDCGSAFQPAAGITPMDCDSRLNGAGTDVALLTGAGVIFGAAGFRWMAPRRGRGITEGSGGATP